MSSWRNCIVEYGEEIPSQLLANPHNWRVHSVAQQATMVGVLEEVGWVQNVIVNQITGHVLDGHMRITLAMRHDPQTAIPVTYVRLTPEEEALVLATYDPIAALATRDALLLSDLLAALPPSENEHIDALLVAEQAQALELTGYAHQQTISKQAKTASRSRKLAEESEPGSRKQLVFALDAQDHETAIRILEELVERYAVDATSDALMMLLIDWDDGRLISMEPMKVS